MLEAFRPRRGFTLTELLIVVGVIGVLSGVVITAVNPSHQLVVANDAKREAATRTIQNAMYEYLIDEETGLQHLENLDGTPRPICNPDRESEPEGGCVNLDVLVEEDYLTAMPVDALEVQGAGPGIPLVTGFTISLTTGGQVTADAIYSGQGTGTVAQSEAELMVYWTDPSTKTIQRRRSDGAGSVEIVYDETDGLTLPYDIDYHQDGDVFYVKNRLRMLGGNLDGTFLGQVGPLVNFAGPAFTVNNTTGWLHLGGEWPYYMRYIRRLNPDTTDFSGYDLAGTDTAAGADAPFLGADVTLDESQGRAYWLKGYTNEADEWAVFSRKINNSDAAIRLTALEANVRGYAGGITGLTLHADTNQLCWTAYETAGQAQPVKITCAGLNGSSPHDVVTGLQFPADLEIDPAGQRIYWADPGSGTIGSARLSGGVNTDVRTIASAADGLAQPYGVMLVPLQ